MFAAMSDRPEIKYRNPRPQLDLVCAAIVEAHGLLSVAAKNLDLTPHNLRLYIKNHAKAGAALREARQRMGDFTEGRLFELIKARDYRAIAFYLSTQCRDRGYGLPRGATLGDNQTNVTIQSVTISPIRSGEFLDAPGIEIDGRAVLGGRTIEPDDDDDKSRLN